MLLLAVLACAPAWDSDRLPALEGLDKVEVADDVYPPVLSAAGEAVLEEPVPLEGAVNTAGAEDSPFWSEEALFFFFTPDPGVPAQEQVLDGVTGIWVAPHGAGSAERVRLSGQPDDALDGCPCLDGDTLWFCSVRAGNVREVDLWTATWDGAEASDWTHGGERLNQEIGVGEVHVLDRVLWFGSDLGDGLGDADLYRLDPEGGSWGEPVHLGGGPNTAASEVLPWVEPGGELWYTAPSERGLPGPALWRSTWDGEAWSEGEEMVGSFAGEPTLDDQGSVYFTHHYYTEGPGEMLEADIYVARRAGR